MLIGNVATGGTNPDAATPTAMECWSNTGISNLRSAPNCNAKTLFTMAGATVMFKLGDDTTALCGTVSETWHHVSVSTANGQSQEGWVKDTHRIGPTPCSAPVDSASTSSSTVCVNTVIDGRKLCTIGGCTVARKIGPKFTEMMKAAAAAGHALTCASSFRSRPQQLEMRAHNCGGRSHYNLFEKPSKQCSPPTARPGRSNHERGLAVDFKCAAHPSAKFRTTDCHAWMEANAAKYGFKKDNSQPWHYSVNGK